MLIDKEFKIIVRRIQMRKKIILMSVLLLAMGTMNAALPVTDGLVMHLDASQITATDGDPIATWADLSGATNDATQTTAGAQPAYVASNAAFNDLATVSFDGTDDYMNLDGSIVTVNSFTLFIVGNLDVTGVEQYFISGQGGDGNDRLRVAGYGWGDGYMTRVGNTGDANLGGPQDTAAHVIAVTGTAAGWLDGGDKVTVGTNTAGALNPSDFIMGAYYDSGDFPRNLLTGDIAEVVLYNVVLTDEQVAQMNEYLRLKYKPTQAATNPSPTGEAVDIATTLSWDAPEAYTGATYDVYFSTTEPNFLIPAPYGLTTVAVGTSLTTATPVPSPMAYDTTYWWVVDTYEPNDVPILHPGAAWSFTTQLSDSPPVVTTGSDWVTWLESGTVTQAVSGVIDDAGEMDIADADIAWTIQEYPGGAPATAMQMIDRGGEVALPAGETDQALLRDWIGTDTRGVNLAGDPLTLTINGLPNGTYTLTTIHHDLGDQTGTFNITIDGFTVATDIDITSGIESPITRHGEMITSDGVTPIEIVFDLNERPEDPNAFFVMNGLEIEDASSNVVMIDFGNNTANISSTYEGYIATHENPDTFGPVYYPWGSGYVSITPTWGQDAAFATVTKTNTGFSSTADFTTTQTGTYVLRLTAADDAAGGNPIPQVDWDVLEVLVVDNACDAAQLDPAWTGFLNGDLNEDCNVDLGDLAELASEWLLSNEAAGSVEL